MSPAGCCQKGALFDLVVAENGGIPFDTKTNEEMGFAARFASGYLAVALGHPEEPISGSARRSTHAWAQIYLPGPGWIDFDPTSGSAAGKQRSTQEAEAVPNSAMLSVRPRANGTSA